MKKIRNVVLILALFMCFNGCEKNRVDEESPNQNSKFTIEQAQAWFGTDWQGAVELKSGNTEEARIGIKPDWCDGFTSQNNEVELVEVGLLVQGYFGFACEDSYNDWKTTKNQKMIRSLTRMVFLKSKKDGRIDQFLMTIVGDKEYHGNKAAQLSDNSYLKREKHFSGYIYYHDITGNFVNAWKYEQGKVVAKTSQTSGEGLPIRLKLATICTSTTSYKTYVNCYYWTQSNNVSSDIANLSECGSPYTIAVTTIDCQTTDGIGLGNVGGGYAPPASQPCNCPDKCTTCGKCLGSTLKSAVLPGDGTTTTPATDPCEYCSGHPEPNIDIDGYNNLNSDEKALIKKYPLEAIKIAENKQKAEEMTISLFGYNGLNDCADAFRHAYFQALNTISIGSLLTQDFSDAHESDTPIQLILEKQMDLHNNSIGINIGTNCYHCDLSAKIMESLRNGELYFLSPIDQNDPNFINTHGITNQTRFVSTSNCY